MKEKNNNQNQNQSTQIIATVLAIAILIVAVVGISFAAFTYSKTGTKDNTITTGTITMLYTEGDKGISIENAMPVSDPVGKAFTEDNISGSGTIKEGAAGVFDFNVDAKITGDVTINYDIMAVKNQESTLDDQYAKLYLQKDTTDSTMAAAEDATAPTTYESLGAASTATTTAGKAVANAKLLHTDSFTESDTHYYRLKMWVSDDYQVGGTAQTFTVTIDVYGQAA